MPEPILSARLAIRYPGLDLAVDLEVGRGELVSILGPSGSGKTTTLRLIAGFEHPVDGRVVLDGADVTALPPEKRGIGIVFQDYALFPHLDVAANVGYAPRLRRLDAPGRAGEVRHWLELVGLVGFGARDVRGLSGGEQQRVAIARSLAARPHLMLLDEPFSSIDPVLRRELRGSLVALQRELCLAMVFVTHSQEEALAISDRIVVMRQGRVAQVGTPDQLYLRPVDRFVARFVGEATLVGGVAVRRGESLLVRAHRDLVVRAAGWDGRDGERVTVCVRPERMRFGDAGSPNAVETVVLSRQYFGHYHAYTCRMVGAQPPDDVAVVYDGARREVGSRAHLTFGPDDAIILPGDGPPAPHATSFPEPTAHPASTARGRRPRRNQDPGP